MTCFWDAILSSLRREDFILLGFTHHHHAPPKITTFIQKLKDNNSLTETLWQGKSLTLKEREEHFEAVRCYEIKNIHKGHLTSICDSFLLLLCHLLHINIRHRFMGTDIVYSVKQPRKLLNFHSNQRHFSR